MLRRTTIGAEPGMRSLHGRNDPPPSETARQSREHEDSAPVLRLALLGSMAAEDRDGRSILPRVRKTRAVLAILAMGAPKPVLREELTGLLWSTRGRPQALASLRQSIHELQDILGPLDRDLLQVDRAQILLRMDRVWVDLRALGTAVCTDPRLVRGPLLADLGGLDPAFDTWLVRQRRRAASIARAALSDRLEGAEGPKVAVEIGKLLTALDPTDETTGRGLITAYANSGDLGAAERCLDLLRDARALAGEMLSPETEGLLATLAAPWPASSSEEPADVRLGVLPLRGRDGSTEDALSLGLAEEITTALSQFRGVSCVASTTLWRLIATEDGIRSGLDTLKLDFLLDGTIERDGARVKIQVRLLDMHAGREVVVWTRRFERSTADLFAMQDEIAAEIAAQVDPALLLRRGSLAGAKLAADPGAHELTLRAIPAVYRLDPAGYREAGVLLQAAVTLDPNYPAAHAWLAYWHLFLVGQGWAEAGGSSIMLAEALAERAVMLDPGDARALTLAGHVRAFLHRRADEAIALHERALSLNPNLTWAWTFSSLAHTYGGAPEEGLRRAYRAKRLAPLDPHGFMSDAAILVPLLTLGRFGETATLGKKAIEAAPHFSANWKIHAAALGHLGAIGEAGAVVMGLLQREPDFTLRAAFDRCPLLKPAHRDLYVEGLRLAGLPDGNPALSG